MKIRSRPRKKARIEIIPMIDVIFFLLVFFMVSSLASTRLNAVPVALPETSSAPQAIRPPIVLSVRKNGDIFVGQAKVSLEILGETLAHAMSGRPQDAVVVNADEGSAYGLVLQAMDQARKIGVRKFALATKSGADKK